jgi:hypothetical protein
MADNITAENLVTVLNAVMIRPRWRPAMAAIGMSEQTAFKWMDKSRAAAREGDTSSPFYLQWSEKLDWWHHHIGRARNNNLIAYEAIVRDQAAFGIEVPMLDVQGRQIWKEDPAKAGMTDQELLDFYGTKDRLLRDAKGDAIPQVRIEQVPATTRNLILQQIPNYRPDPPSTHVHNNTAVFVGGASPAIAALRKPPALPAPETDMVRDLRAHLAKGVTNAKPDGPVEILGRPTGDKPDRVSHPSNETAVPDLRDHPRAYTVPAPAPDYSRKVSSGGIDQAGIGRGPDPSKLNGVQGFKVR